MIIQEEQKVKLRFYREIVLLEMEHLEYTDEQLFKTPFTQQKAESLKTDKALAERVDAFVGRFSRLQDTIGDKLLPCLLEAMNEKQSAFLDNLDRAEKLGLLESSDEWIAIRGLRNKMVHEYIKDYQVLADAIQTAHDYIPVFKTIIENIVNEIEKRAFI